MDSSHHQVGDSDWLKFYPVSPMNPPAALREGTTKYKVFVVAVVLALFLFVALYLAMIVGSGYLVWWSWQGEPNLFLAFLSGMFFLFLIKTLFKWSKPEPEDNIEISPEEYPVFFQFLQQLCLELQIPPPHRVFLSGDTNAFVFWPRSIFHLFLPLQKELTVGAGLITALNLSEFKAVMAHELGHVGQKGLRTGIYVRMIQGSMQDMIWSRDLWDRLLGGWMAIGYGLLGGGLYGIVLSLFLLIPGWTLLLIVSIFRYFLGFLFYGISLLSAGLLRQAEFFADRIAVSVAGSDAICHALLKLEFAEACSSHSIDELIFAAELGLITDDIYLHQEAIRGFLRKRHDKPNWGVIPPEGEALFTVDEEMEELSLMSTHPAHWQREKSAKELYVKGPTDDRSAWCLFPGNDFRQRLTKLFWKHRGDVENLPFTDAQEVQDFLKADRLERAISPHYHGLYDTRPIQPDDFQTVVRQVKKAPLDDEELLETYHSLYDDSLKERHQTFQEMQEEFALLSVIMDGDIPAPSEYLSRGTLYQEDEIPDVFFQLRDDVEAEIAWFNSLDTKVLRVHIQMALELDSFVDEKEATFFQELKERYQFHLTLQELLMTVGGAAQRLAMPLELLNGQVDFSEDEVDRINVDFAGVFEILVGVLEAAETVQTVSLLRVEAGQPLSSILKANTPWEHAESELDDSMEVDLLQQLINAHGKLNHLHDKSLGRLLAHQEHIAAEWQTYKAIEDDA